MDAADLKPNEWYWIRRDDGSLAPHLFHRTSSKRGRLVGEFYVGSMLQSWPLSRVVGPAHMPEIAKNQRMIEPQRRQ